MNAPPKLAVKAISKQFRGPDGWFPVLRDVSLTLSQGEFVSILGPSGCGKSTLFNVIAGLERTVTGCVLLDGRDITGSIGQVGYMPQKDLLFPWKTVLDNTIVGARMAGVSRGVARREALTWFPIFGLQGFEQAFPDSLSGGMRQRAALLRTALARRDVLLLDEPFGALDALTRADMQTWLLTIRRDLGKSIVLITHDVEEAVYLSDRVYVMSHRPGRIVKMVEIALPIIHDHDLIVTSAAFVAYKRRLLDALRSDSAANRA